MPIRGENIGTAYVRIVADGDKMDESVRDALDNEGVFDEFEQSGRKTSAKWREGFEKEMAKAPNQSALRDAIASPLARGDWLSTNFFRSRNWSNFRTGIEKEFGEAGKRAVRSLEAGLLTGRIDMDALNARLENMMPLITQERINMNREMLDQAYRMNKEFDRKNRRIQDEADADFEQHIRDRQAAVENLRDKYGDLLVSVNRLSKGERGLHRRDLIARITNLRTEMDRAGGSTEEWEFNLRTLERRLISIHPRTDRATRGIDRFADSVGRLTGRGSRNDFLNFFGSVNRGFVRMFSIVPRLVGSMQNLVGIFGEASAGKGGGFGGFLSGIGAVAFSAGKGLAAFAAAAVVLVTMLGPAIALLSSLLAIITALVSTIGFALVGALAAAGGLLVTLGGAAGIAALAFANLDDKQKKLLKNNFKPVIDQFKELSDIAAGRLFRNLGGLGDQIAAGMERAEPLVRKTADAIRDVGISFGDSLQSRGYRQFITALEQFLPDATRRLGDIIGQTLGGFGGIFRGMIPFLEETLEWLDRITGRFSRWANSARGQNQIEDWFRKASDSAKAFGDFLGEVGELLGEVLGAGRSTGDDLFTSMADNIQRFTDYLRENPDALKNWFADAKDIAEDIGDLFVAIGKLIDKLDSPEARRAVEFFLNLGEFVATVVRYTPGIEDLASGISRLMDAFSGDGGKGGSGPSRALSAMSGISRIARASNPLFSALASTVGRLWQSFHDNKAVQKVEQAFRRLPGRIRSAISGIPGRFRAIFDQLPDPVKRNIDRAVKFFRDLPSRVRSAIASIPSRFRGVIDGIPGTANSILNRVNTHFRNLPGRIRSGISGIPGIVQGIFNRLPGPVQNVITRVINFFRNLPGQIRSALGGLPAAIMGAFNGAVDGIAQIPGRIVGWFSGLGSRIAGAIGSITIPMSSINLPDIPHVPWPFAEGGIVNKATNALIGEAGREAVVPLDRPLSQVDPSVRYLSAVARGQTPTVNPGKTVDVGGITVVSPNADPRAVARETINALMASAY